MNTGEAIYAKNQDGDVSCEISSIEIDGIPSAEHKIAIGEIGRASIIGKATEPEIRKTICDKGN